MDPYFFRPNLCTHFHLTVTSSSWPHPSLGESFLPQAHLHLGATFFYRALSIPRDLFFFLGCIFSSRNVFTTSHILSLASSPFYLESPPLQADFSPQATPFLNLISPQGNCLLFECTFSPTTTIPKNTSIFEPILSQASSSPQRFIFFPEPRFFLNPISSHGTIFSSDFHMGQSSPWGNYFPHGTFSQKPPPCHIGAFLPWGTLFSLGVGWHY